MASQHGLQTAATVTVQQLQEIHTQLLDTIGAWDRGQEQSRARRRKTVNHAEQSSQNGESAPVLKVACNACKEGKARCDGTPPAACTKCKKAGIECIYARPGKRGRKKAETSPEAVIHKKLQDLLQIVEQVISPQPQVPAQHEPQMSGVQTWDASPPASTMDQSFAANISNPLAVLANISLRDEESDAHAAIQSLPPEDIHPYDLFLRPQEFYAEGIHPSKPDSNQTAWDPVNIGLLTADEFASLLNFYYTNLYRWLWQPDPVIYNATRLRQVSPFLASVLASLAASYDPCFTFKAHNLYNHTLNLSVKIFAEGFKSLEIVIAYTILVHWAPPATDWLQDQSWTWLGEALRMATEIRLDLPLTPREEARYNIICSSRAPNGHSTIQRLRSRALSLLVLSEITMCTHRGIPQAMRSSSLTAEFAAIESGNVASEMEEEYNLHAHMTISGCFTTFLSEWNRKSAEQPGFIDDAWAMDFQNRWNSEVQDWQRNWPSHGPIVDLLFQWRSLLVCGLIAQSCSASKRAQALQQCKFAATHVIESFLGWDPLTLRYSSNYTILNVAHATILSIKLPSDNTDLEAASRERAKLVGKRLLQVAEGRSNALSLASLHGSRILALVNGLEKSHVSSGLPSEQTFEQWNYDQLEGDAPQFDWLHYITFASPAQGTGNQSRAPSPPQFETQKLLSLWQ